MIAALRDLQIAVMPRRELQPRIGHQVEERVRRHRGGFVDGADDFLILMRAGNGEDVGEAFADRLRFLAHAAGDDHAAVFGNRLADRLEAFLLG